MAGARYYTPLHRFKLTGGVLSHNGQAHSLVGARAEVASSGSRRVYLTITGPGWSHTAWVRSWSLGMARRFAGKVNAAATQVSLVP
jgi:hypothetical protein